MKKKNTPIKVVAISTIATVALAGIAAVSVFSLAKNPDSVATSGIQNADSDTAMGKLAVREDAVAETPVVLDVAGVAEQAQGAEAAPVYTVSEVVEAPAELVVVSSVVEQTASAEDIPVIASVQVTETVVEETALAAAETETVELAVVNTEPIFAPPVEEPVAVEPEEPVAVAVEAEPAEATVHEIPAAPVAAEPVVVEPEVRVASVEQEIQVAAEEPEYVEPVYDEPDYSTEYEIQATDNDYDYDYDYDYNYVNVAADDAEDETVEYQGMDMSGTPASTSASGLREQLVSFANSRVGNTPYVWAGTSLETGTDCSGFVSLVYNNFGLYASSGSDDYQNVEGEWGTNISYDELQPGDVVVYRNGGHVGIYAGQDENGTDLVIHDSNEIDGVKVSEMDYSTPTAFVRVTGMDSPSTSSSSSYVDDSYSDDEDYADEWYYGYDDESDDDYGWDYDEEDWY